MTVTKAVNNNDFPGYYTIDDDGLDSLCYFLRESFKNKTVRISIEIEKEINKYCV
jgi:hypothetical protein